MGTIDLDMALKSPDIGTRIKKAIAPTVIGVGLGIAGAQYVTQPPEATTFALERGIEGVAGRNVLCRQSLVEIGNIMGSEDAGKIADKTWGAITMYLEKILLKEIL